MKQTQAAFLSCDDEGTLQVPFPDDVFYHGEDASNCDVCAEMPEARPERSGADRLRLYRIGNDTRHLTEAGANWIVSSTLRQTMGRVPNVTFCDVEFVKVIDPATARDQFIRWKTPINEFDDYMSTEEWMETLPDSPELRKGLGRYYGMTAPLIKDVSPALYSAVGHETSSYQKHRDLIKEHLTEAVLEDFPALRTFGGLLVAEGVLYSMLPLVDTRFIDVQVFELRK